MKTLITLTMLLLLESCGQGGIPKAARRLIGADYEGHVEILHERIDNLEAQINQDLLNLISQLQSSNDSNDLKHNSLQQQINNLTIELAELEGNTITEIIDPCGKQAAFDEVILKTGDGRFLAYFESGSRRFLAELFNGTYITTDETGCTFKILDGLLAMGNAPFCWIDDMATQKQCYYYSLSSCMETVEDLGGMCVAN